jgi:hypothetical protein
LVTVLIVDVQGSTRMVAAAGSEPTAVFMCDVLQGSAEVIGRCGGMVVNTMGDALLALFDDPEQTLASTWSIVRDFDRQHAYFEASRRQNRSAWTFVRGMYCRCALETGWVQRAPLDTHDGRFTLYTGDAINYADRIIRFPERAYRGWDPVFRRNTVVVGPRAHEILGKMYLFDEPLRFRTRGGTYVAHPFDTRELFNR